MAQWPRSAGDTRRKNASFQRDSLHSALKGGILRPLLETKLKSRFQWLEPTKPNVPEAQAGLLSTESYAEPWITGQLPSEDSCIQKNSMLAQLQWTAVQSPRCMVPVKPLLRGDRPLKSSCAQPMAGMCMVRRAGRRGIFLLKNKATGGWRPSMGPPIGAHMGPDQERG